MKMAKRVLAVFLAVLLMCGSLAEAAFASSGEPAGSEPDITVSGEPTDAPDTGEPAPEATEEPAPEVTEEPAPEATEEPAPEATEEPAPEATEEPVPEATEGPAPAIQTMDLESQSEEHTVTYKVGGHIPEGYEVPQSLQVAEGETYTVAGQPAGYEGYAFDGWYLNGRKVGDRLTMGKEDVTLTGTWTERDHGGEVYIVMTADKSVVYEAGEKITYTITLYNNSALAAGDYYITATVWDDLLGVWKDYSYIRHGSQETITGTYEVTQADIDAGYIVNTARSHWNNPGRFFGWGDGTSTVTVPVVVLPDKHTVTYKVSGHIPEGYEAPGSKVLLEGASVDTTAPKAEDYPDYAFDGWYLNGRKVGDGLTMGKADMTLTGAWTRKDYKGEVYIVMTADKSVVHEAGEKITYPYLHLP